jgi:F-type H+-transporting ATPase subunit b
VVVFMQAGGHGWAAEDAKTWRATYDLIMMWVNFGILAFFVVKYARKPLIGFLEGESRKTAEEIQRIEESSQQMERKFQETVGSLDDSRERLRLLQERILREGELRKREIIDSARHESELLLERARLKIDIQIAEAHERLKRELVDRAVAAAMERLPAEITPEEQLRLVDRFVQKAGSA